MRQAREQPILPRSPFQKTSSERRNLKLADVHKITHNPQARTTPAIRELLLRIEGDTARCQD